MTTSLRWKLIAAFVLVFVAGAICSQLFVSPHMLRMYFGRSHHGSLAEHMREHLRRELNLTPQQLEQVAPIIDSTATRFEAIRTETTRQVAETFAEQHRQLASILSPEQREKLQALERRHRRALHHHGFPPHPPMEHQPEQ